MKGEIDADETTGNWITSIQENWFDLLVYLFLLLWISALLYQVFGWNSRYDRFFPLFIGLPLAFFILFKIAFIISPNLKTKLYLDQAERISGSADDKKFTVDSNDKSVRDRAERRQIEIYMVVWTVALPFLLYYIGFLIFPIYIFSFTWFFKKDIKTAIMITVIFSVMTFGLLVQLLGIRLWEGVLFSAL